MKKIILPRGGGKTKALIKMAAKEGFTIVCLNKHEAIRVHVDATSKGFRMPFPLTFDEFKHRSFNPSSIKGFLIDEADRLIQSMSKIPVIAIAMTEDPEISSAFQDMDADADKSTRSSPPMLDRRINSMPVSPCIMEVLKKNYDGDELCICQWEPAYDPLKLSKGYLGTAIDLRGGYRYNAWAQNEHEFTHYRVLYHFDLANDSKLITMY